MFGPNNSIIAGNGKNTVTGVVGNNVIKLGDGGNTIVANGANNTLTTGAGKDTITSGGGNAEISTGAGDDTITLSGSGNVVDAGSGSNMIFIKSGNNNRFVLHTAGTDTLQGFTASSGSVFDVRSVISENKLKIGDFNTLAKYFAVISAGGDADLAFSSSGNVTKGYTVLADLGSGSGITSLTDLKNHGELRFS